MGNSASRTPKGASASATRSESTQIDVADESKPIQSKKQNDIHLSSSCSVSESRTNASLRSEGANSNDEDVDARSIKSEQVISGICLHYAVNCFCLLSSFLY